MLDQPIQEQCHEICHPLAGGQNTIQYLGHFYKQTQQSFATFFAFTQVWEFALSFFCSFALCSSALVALYKKSNRSERAKSEFPTLRNSEQCLETLYSLFIGRSRS